MNALLLGESFDLSRTKWELNPLSHSVLGEPCGLRNPQEQDSVTVRFPPALGLRCESERLAPSLATGASRDARTAPALRGRGGLFLGA
jgi:hypothetical protein